MDHEEEDGTSTADTIPHNHNDATTTVETVGVDMGIRVDMVATDPELTVMISGLVVVMTVNGDTVRAKRIEERNRTVLCIKTNPLIVTIEVGTEGTAMMTKVPEVVV